MICNGCKIGYVESLRIFHNRRKCFKVFTDHGIKIPRVKCIECDEIAELSNDNSHWYCRSGHGFELLTRPDDWLESLYLSPSKCCLFMSLYLQTDSPHEDLFSQSLRISHDLAACWAVYLREVLQDWCLHNSTDLLGGPNITVDMNEAELENDKYRARSTEAKWIFSAFEKDTYNFFFEEVPNRSSSTLIEVIKRKIRPGTKILFKSQTACSCLKEEGFNCLKADYNIIWFDPTTATYTHDVPRIVPEDTLNDFYKGGHIADFLFRKRFDHRERLHHFLLAVKNFDPKLSDSLINNNLDRNFDENDPVPWTSVIYLITCFAYFIIASIFFRKILVKYNIYPFAGNNNSTNINAL